MPLLRLLAALALLVIAATPSPASEASGNGEMCGDNEWNFFEVPLDNCPGSTTLQTIDETCEYFASAYTLEYCTICADVSLPAEICVPNPLGPPDYYFDHTLCYATHEESCRQ
jgi:hypothetical protein